MADARTAAGPRRGPPRAILRRVDRGLPLSVKITAPTLLIAAVAASLVGSLVVRGARQHFSEAYQTQNRVIAHIVASQYFTEETDSAAMTRFLEDIRNSTPLLLHVRVYRMEDGRRRLWADSGTAAAAAGRPGQRGNDRPAQPVLMSTYPVGTPSAPAWVEITISARELQGAIRRAQRELLLTLALAGLGFVAAVSIVFYVFVFKRSKRLARAAARVADGDLSVRLPEGDEPWGRDSLVNVAREFDRMLRAVEARTRQHAAVAELGQRALSGAEVPDLLDEAVRLVARGLDVEYASVLERVDDGFRVRAGVGWSDGVVGARVPFASQAGYTVQSGRAVLSEDLTAETRFPVTPILREHHVRSSASTPIRAAEGAFGVLAAHTARGREFDPDDLLFLRSMANGLGWAIQHRLARQQLAEAEAQYRSLVERIPAITYTAQFGPSGRWEYVSPQIESLLGFPAGEWIEDPTMWYRQLHPEDREQAIAEETESRRSGRAMTSEYRMCARSGRIVWFRDEAVVIHDPDGRPVNLQGVMYDITEQKVAEEALATAYRREREAVDRLRAVDEMKNAFLTAVSHELRTPLASVLGFARTLQMEEIDLPPQERREMLDRLVANAQKLDRLLSDLLDLDRLGRGIVEPRREQVNVGSMAQRIAREADLSGRAVEVEAESVTVGVDAAQVERILENLLGNAAKHTPPDAPVRLMVRREDGGVLIAVEDGGPGVPDDLKDSVFQPFERGAQNGGDIPGTGIGLSLVARFAELHGGRVWVEDRPGGGASFRVFLPSEAPDGPGEHGAEPAALSPAPDPSS